MKKEATIPHPLYLPCLLMVLSLLRPITGDARARAVQVTCSPQLAHNETAYVTNFVSTIENISQQVKTAGFGVVLTGSGPDANYGLAQCYGDLPLKDCVLCYTEARTMLPQCFPKNGGRIFLDGCFMRAENYSFYKEFEGPEDNVVCGNTTTKTATFGDAVREGLRNAVAKASGKGGYARAKAGKSESAFVLANCWRTLSPDSCKQCLENASISVVNRCLPWSEGRALHTGCFLRYSDQDFLNKIPRKGLSGGVVAVIVLSVLSSVCVFVTGFVVGLTDSGYSTEN